MVIRYPIQYYLGYIQGSPYMVTLFSTLFRVVLIFRSTHRVLIFYSIQGMVIFRVLIQGGHIQGTLFRVTTLFRALYLGQSPYLGYPIQGDPIFRVPSFRVVIFRVLFRTPQDWSYLGTLFRVYSFRVLIQGGHIYSSQGGTLFRYSFRYPIQVGQSIFPRVLILGCYPIQGDHPIQGTYGHPIQYSKYDHPRWSYSLVTLGTHLGWSYRVLTLGYSFRVVVILLYLDGPKYDYPRYQGGHLGDPIQVVIQGTHPRYPIQVLFRVHLG